MASSATSRTGISPWQCPIRCVAGCCRRRHRRWLLDRLADHVSTPHSVELVLEPADNQRLANLCGPLDEHLRQMERGFGMEIHNRGNQFKLVGPAEAVDAARKLLK